MSLSHTKLELAERHLARVLAAWPEPDWADLGNYGLYCLEAAVEAAAAALGVSVKKHHWGKASLASRLRDEHGLPDVEGLLRDLNDARKAENYGDVRRPDLNAEDVASEIERYVDEVKILVARLDQGEQEDVQQ